MTEHTLSSNTNKLQWQTPRLAPLGMGLEEVRNGFLNGTDGAGGFSATSAS